MREPKLIVATGKKGVGKTYTTKQLISRYVRGNPRTGKKPRKVLIYDVNMEYTQYKAIAVEDLPRFTLQNRVEVRRVLPMTVDGKVAKIDEMVSIMSQILDNYAGGLLILEDINRYLIDTKTQDIIGTLCTNRHRDLDIIIHLQSLSAMTTRMWQNCSTVRFHEQSDDIERYEKRIPNFECFKIAQFLTKDQHKRGNTRFYCYVSNEEDYIKGKFSKRDFEKACEEYILQYPAKVNRIKRQYGTNQEAYYKAKKEVLGDLRKYNGNLKNAA